MSVHLCVYVCLRVPLLLRGEVVLAPCTRQVRLALCESFDLARVGRRTRVLRGPRGATDQETRLTRAQLSRRFSGWGFVRGRASVVYS